MFCKNCGQIIDDNINICIHCNEISNDGKYNQYTSFNLVVISACCFPLVGMVLYFKWKYEKPRSANLVLNWTIVGMIFWLILYIISFGFGILISVYS